MTRALHVPELNRTLVGRQVDYWTGLEPDGSPLRMSEADRAWHVARLRGERPTAPAVTLHHLPIRPLVCADLGDKVDPGCACTDRACKAGRGTVRHLEHCQACDGYRRPGEPAATFRSAGPFEWVSTARLTADAIVLAGKLPPDIVGVAGVPRSGMLPAATVATHLHLPLYELSDRLRRVGSGSRGNTLPTGSGRIAVVDDTVYGGAAMRRAREAVKGQPAVFAAVYARPEAGSAVDVFARELPSPHLLEWNLANSGPFAGFAADGVYGAGVGMDLDGVIVHDAESGGPILSPYLVPRTHPCKLIATGRSEGHRAATEALLRAVGARWERLEMLTAGEELTPENAARHKAKHYGGSPLGFFVESCPVQAELIHRLTGKPVICPRAGKVWQ